MKRAFYALLLSISLVVAGCSAAGTPKAVTPETSVDFGNVPVVVDMTQAQRKRFVIKNEGTANLKLSKIQVKVLQGC